MTASCRQGDAVTKKRKIEIQYKANKPPGLIRFYYTLRGCIRSDDYFKMVSPS